MRTNRILLLLSFLLATFAVLPGRKVPVQILTGGFLRRFHQEPHADSLCADSPAGDTVQQQRLLQRTIFRKLHGATRRPG